MELRSLNDFLSTKFTFDQTKSLKCSHCNHFIGTNKKSLTVHIRRCIKKLLKLIILLHLIIQLHLITRQILTMIHLNIKHTLLLYNANSNNKFYYIVSMSAPYNANSNNKFYYIVSM